MIVHFKPWWVFFWGGDVHWKTDNKLFKTVTKWNFEWIMSPLRHSCVTEPGMVWHKVKGTRDRIMGMGPCTEWCDKSVKYYAKMFVTRVWISQNTPMTSDNQMGDAHIHSLCLSKSKRTQNLHPPAFWRPQPPARCCCSNSCHPVSLQAAPWGHHSTNRAVAIPCSTGSISDFLGLCTHPGYSDPAFSLVFQSGKS